MRNDVYVDYTFLQQFMRNDVLATTFWLYAHLVLLGQRRGQLGVLLLQLLGPLLDLSQLLLFGKSGRGKDKKE